MQVRLARPGDLAELPLIEVSAAQRFRRLDHLGADLDGATPVELLRPRQEAGTIWVAEEAGRLIGFAACEACSDALHLLELDVRLEAQGHGVGRALIAVVAEATRRLGLPAVTLTTFADIPWNGPFYE